ncbi:MAG: hypothetical protein AB1467_05860 [Candidatus Diapherotrites archaeon]
MPAKRPAPKIKKKKPASCRIVRRKSGARDVYPKGGKRRTIFHGADEEISYREGKVRAV